jgi:hypothetical protein
MAMRYLADAPMTKLRLLSLTNNPVGDNGIKSLVKSPHLSNLLVLNLDCTRLTDVAARALLDWPAVSDVVYLGLSDNNFSLPMRKELKKRFGDRTGFLGSLD